MARADKGCTILRKNSVTLTPGRNPNSTDSEHGLTSHRHVICHFGVESFEAINCTGTDNQNNKQIHYIQPKHKRQTK